MLANLKTMVQDARHDMNIMHGVINLQSYNNYLVWGLVS